MIPRRPLGRTGIAVSALGFGVSGPHGSAVMSDGAVGALVATAVEGGVTLFDTAPFYGAAEARLGAALRGLSGSNIVVCGKAGKRRVGRALIPAFSPQEIEASVHASLGALNRDRLDILLLHGPGAADLERSADTLLRLRQAGVVGAIGACCRGAEAAALLATGLVEVIQAPIGSDSLRAAVEAGAGALGIEAIRAAAPGVRASVRPVDLWYSARAIVRRAPPPSQENPVRALGRALSTPGVSCVIATTTRASHLRENVAAARDV
jgi:D-threo-aldose 1-dehydrogenase